MKEDKMINASETKRIKARNLRYKKPIVKDINLFVIKENLDNIYEECMNVKYYFDSDDDTLINALDGDEDEEFEFKMMFSDLCAECEQMLSDLDNVYIPECFDDFFVAIGGAKYGGGLLGWDSYEQDYFGIEISDSFVERESRKRLERFKKTELIESAHACFKVLYAYLGIQDRYSSLKAALDILKDENTGYLQVVKKIEEYYNQANEDGFQEWNPATKELERLIEQMSDVVWIQ